MHRTFASLLLLLALLAPRALAQTAVHQPERPVPLADPEKSVAMPTLEPAVDTLAFPDLLSCTRTTKLRLKIHNRGTVADTLNAININSPFIVLLLGNATIAGNSSVEIEVTFAPVVDGAYSTPLTYTYTSGADGSIITDTVIVTGSRLPASYAITGADFGEITVGSSGSATATVTNRNTTTIRIASAEIIPASPDIAIAPGQFPMRVPPGGTGTITLLYTPSAVGDIPPGTTLRVHIDSICPIALDTLITGRGIPGDLVLSRQTIPYDGLLGCHDADSTVTLTNIGKAPVTLTGAVILPGGPSFILVPAFVPVTLAPGDSTPLTVRFAPGPGADASLAGTLRISTTDPLRPTIDIPLGGVRLTHSAALAGPGFPLIGAGSSTSTRRWIINTGTAPMTIGDLRVGAPFAIASTTPGLPATLLPGDSLELELDFAPTVPGEYADSIAIGLIAACDSLAVTVSGSAEDRSIIAGPAVWGDVSGAPGDTVLIPLRIEGDLAVTKVTSFSAGARFNPTLLRPLGVELGGTIIADWRIEAQQLLRGSVQFTARGDRPLSGTGVLVWLRAQVLLGDSTATPVAGSDSVSTNAPRAALSVSPGIFTLSGYCADGGARLVTAGSAAALKSVSPHPIVGSARIEVVLAESGPTTLALLDPLGGEALRLLDGELAPRSYIVTLSAADFPSGVYYLELRTPTQIMRRKVMIVR